MVSLGGELNSAVEWQPQGQIHVTSGVKSPYRYQAHQKNNYEHSKIAKWFGSLHVPEARPHL
jgi:hypothetical protein